MIKFSVSFTKTDPIIFFTLGPIKRFLDSKIINFVSNSRGLGTEDKRI